MLRGLYTAAAGMISQQRKHDTVTNNIANLNTPGYKQNNAVSRSFPEMLISLTNGETGGRTSRAIGRLNTGVLAEEDPSVYVQGDLQETKNTFDFALVSDIQLNNLAFDGRGMAFDANGERVFQPQAFFTVQDAAGQLRYSRNGKFTANDQGELVTSEGYKVLGTDGQPIVLADGNGTFLADAKLTPDGRFLDSQNGQPLVKNPNTPQQAPLQIMVSKIENPNRLIREGNGVYRVNEGDEGLVTPVTANDQVEVRQGYLERSNVDAAQSMVDMNTALRAYEANQKVVQYYDKSLEKAVNEVGRV
ncbi:flagellar hook-basal body protein [Paenibacillus aurantius]|uniref:Flagellar hook-basal body protein n=1 Tax=Paenibacillus aurantius TaxID=2918900 RepID=A0AA96RDN2_9BACL|nr:flagellar hook-basal body protein [Paenibacillus aurantius]WNQ11575.1 flagellar hook-basal body protein [Paenibacillus aurantius]